MYVSVIMFFCVLYFFVYEKLQDAIGVHIPGEMCWMYLIICIPCVYTSYYFLHVFIDIFLYMRNCRWHLACAFLVRHTGCVW